MEWISVKKMLPPVQWTEPDEEGRKYFYCIPVLVCRKFIVEGEEKQSIAVGEHDTSCIPDVWYVLYEKIDEEKGLCNEEMQVTDVTHWMPLPKPPENNNVG